MQTIRWIKLAAKPAANEITLIAADDGGRANALVWSGSAWGNESLLTSFGLPALNKELIGVEYIRAGTEMGKSVVFWPTNTPNINAQVWSGTAWGSPVSKGISYGIFAGSA